MKKVYWPNWKPGFERQDEKGWYKVVEDAEAEELLRTGEATAKADCSESEMLNDSGESRGASGGGLYSNPGKTLKAIAVVMFILELIAAIIVAVLLSDNVLMAVIIIVGGAIVAYLSGLMLAAFGDLAMNVNAIKKKLCSK